MKYSIVEIMDAFNECAKELEGKEKEIERLNNVLDNIGYQIEGIIKTTEEFGIAKNIGYVVSKHNIDLLKKILKMIETKDVSIEVIKSE